MSTVQFKMDRTDLFMLFIKARELLGSCYLNIIILINVLYSYLLFVQFVCFQATTTCSLPK